MRRTLHTGEFFTFSSLFFLLIFASIGLYTSISRNPSALLKLPLLWLLLTVCCQNVLADPNIRLVGHAHSKKKGCTDLIAGVDYLFYTFDISGNNTDYPFTYEGPRFMYTNNGNPVVACTGFDNPSNACTDRGGIADTCSCEMQSSGTYRLSYKRTARLEDSEEKVYVEWQGPPAIQSQMIDIPVIINDSSCADPPSIEKVSFEQVHTAGCTTLIAGRDHIVVQVELTNSNADYPFTYDGPRFYLTNDGTRELACAGFDYPSNACRDRKGEADACSCEMKSPDVYVLSYNRTVKLEDSEESVYLEWAGSRPIRSKEFKVHKVTDFKDCVRSSSTRPFGATMILLASICMAHLLFW